MLSLLVKAEFEASGISYGSPRIKLELNSKGVVADKTSHSPLGEGSRNLQKIYVNDDTYRRANARLSASETGLVPLLVNGESIQMKKIRDHVVDEGQAAIQYDIRALFDAVGIVQDLVEAKRQELPADLEKPLTKAVNIIVNLWGKVSSTIFVQASKRQVKPSPLSDEEKIPLED